MTSAESEYNRDHYPLSGMTVGISVSDVPESELLKRGLSRMHLDDMFWEITRHVLALGADIAYAGDHRKDGFTHRLFDLVRTYTSSNRDPSRRVKNFVIWPHHRLMTAAVRNEVKDVAIIVDCPLPEFLAGDPIVRDLGPIARLALDQPDSRRVIAQCLTAMRVEMTSAIDARIVLGGRCGGIVDGALDSFQGKYPGIIEEVHLSLLKKQPVYVLGAYGGCADVLVNALRGERPEVMTMEYHLSCDSVYKSMVETCSQQPQEEINYESLVNSFHSAGTRGLNNGLDDTLNELLFREAEVEVVVATVLRGLNNIWRAKRGPAV